MQDTFVEDTEKGFPLVLIHGFLGSSNMWIPQINYFSKNFRVICPNISGFGGNIQMKSKDSIKDMSKAIIDYLEKKKIEKLYLLGHSMGGMVVQEMTKHIGDKIKKLVCYGTGPVGNIPGRFETMTETRNRLNKDGLASTAHRIAKTWFVEEDKAKYFYLCKESGNSTTSKAADNALIAMENWNGMNNLKNIKCETLIIWGDKDRAYNFDQVDTLNKEIPNSEMVIFKNCSHNVHLEKPNEFNKEVEKFLNKKNINNL